MSRQRKGGNFSHMISTNFFSSSLLLRFLFPQLSLFSLRKGVGFASFLLIPLLDPKFLKNLEEEDLCLTFFGPK